MKRFRFLLILTIVFLSQKISAQNQNYSKSAFVYSSKDYYIDSEKKIIIKKVIDRELPEPFEIPDDQLAALDDLLKQINYNSYPKDLTVKNTTNYKKLLVVSANCDDEITFSYKLNKKQKYVKWNDCTYKPEHETYITNLRKLNQRILDMVASASE